MYLYRSLSALVHTQNYASFHSSPNPDAELFGRVLTVNIAKPMRIKLGYHRPGAQLIVFWVHVRAWMLHRRHFFGQYWN